MARITQTGRRRGRLAVAVFCAALFTTTACSGIGGAATGSSEKDPNGVLTIAVNRAVEDLNPFAFEAIFNVQSMIFEPLVEYGEGGKLLPCLATSWEQSRDGKTLTFHLRKGVTFSDGAPWNAEAAKMSFDVWVGDEAYSFLESSKVITNVTATDEYTLTLTLSRPYPYVLQELSLVRPVRFLSPNAFNDKGEYGGEPIGTGPWVLKSNTPTETVLTRNESYWGGAPEFAEVDIKVIPDAKTRLTALRTGDIDLIGGDWTAPLLPEDAQEIEAMGNGTELVTAPGTTTQLLAFNPDPSRLSSDPAVREAIGLALDRDAIVENLFLGFGAGAGSLMPDTVPTGEGEPAPAPDTEAAKDVLEAAGWTGDGVRSKDGVPLELEILVAEEKQPGVRQLAEVIQDMLKEIGIAVEINAVDHATSHDDIPEGRYDMTIFYTTGAPYEPITTLTNYFFSTVPTSDGKIWTDPARLDPLITAVLEAPTEEKRAAAYQAVYDFLADQSAFVPLVYQDRRWAHGPQVHDLALPPTEYDFPLDGIWLSKD